MINLSQSTFLESTGFMTLQTTIQTIQQTVQLRRQLRQQRRRLDIFQQRQAEQNTLKHLIKHPQFKQAQKIGIYLNAFGEIHTRKIIKYCFQQGKTVYLPLIGNMNQKLLWVPINAHLYYNRRFAKHPLGMREPMNRRGVAARQLDLLLMPLLACDVHGTRMGMGGGYYDRTLADAPQRPFRIGLAHPFQYLDDALTRQSWDQPLDYLCTPEKIYTFKRRYPIRP